MEESRFAVVIEDDADIRALLAAVLEQAGFRVFTASNGLDGVDLVREHEPLVTTLDVSMPGMDGFETAKRIRAFSDTYLLMLTARTEEIDTLMGLESGADDYVAKPFRPRELRARIDAMLRRPRVHTGNLQRVAAGAENGTTAVTVSSGDMPGWEDTGWLEHNGLRINPETRTTMVDGDEVELTRSEFDILAELVSAGRRVVSKAELALMLRDERHLGPGVLLESDTRAIEVHVANLRRKLGESVGSPRWVETVRGVGYRLTAK